MTLTRKQVKARQRGVGCSELLAALGKDPRCSRLELYMRKVGELPEPDLSQDERVRMGVLLEPVIRSVFAERIGQKVITPRQTIFHPLAPLVGHPDGWIPALATGAEFKAADKFEADDFGEPDSDQVPIRYLVQCAGYMAITNTGPWHLAVLIGGNDLRTYVIPRDPQLEDALLAGVREFWSHVEQRRPPDPATPDDVKLRWPKDLGTTIVATPEIEDACIELAVAKVDLKVAEQKEERLKMEVEAFMKEHAQLVGSDGKLLATWRKAKDSKKFDDKKFAAAEPVLYEQFMRDQPGSRRFLLK